MRIRELRADLGLSQKELAYKVGVTPAYMCGLENGTKKNPSLMLLVRIAKELNVTVTDLLEQRAS